MYSRSPQAQSALKRESLRCSAYTMLWHRSRPPALAFTLQNTLAGVRGDPIPVFTPGDRDEFAEIGGRACVLANTSG